MRKVWKRCRDIMRVVFVIIACLFAITAAGASPPSPHPKNDQLKTRIGRALAEKRPHERQSKLSELADNLTTQEIPRALELSKCFEEWREQMVFQTASLRRWANIAPDDALCYIVKLPEKPIESDRRAVRRSTACH
jgi:hypothetical protein